MRALLNRLSLTLVRAALSLAAIVPMVGNAIAAWQTLATARQAAILADANRHIFAADLALRGERARRLVALSCATSTTTSEQLGAIRKQLCANLEAGLSLLAAAGQREHVGPLEAAARMVVAARAGKAGRGFTVVTPEVMNLATQTGHRRRRDCGSLVNARKTGQEQARHHRAGRAGDAVHRQHPQPRVCRPIAPARRPPG